MIGTSGRGRSNAIVVIEMDDSNSPDEKRPSRRARLPVSTHDRGGIRPWCAVRHRREARLANCSTIYRANEANPRSGPADGSTISRQMRKIAMLEYKVLVRPVCDRTPRCVRKEFGIDTCPLYHRRRPVRGCFMEVEVQALKETLDDEYKARETYAQVIRDFGEVRPFANIVEAEARHVSALLSLFEKHAIEAPSNRWVGKALRFLTVHEACIAAIQGEIENIELYDRALKSTRRMDILTVYRALRSASHDRHLPVFQRCAQRSPRRGA